MEQMRKRPFKNDIIGGVVYETNQGRVWREAESAVSTIHNPAEDYLSDSIDFNRDLIKHPEATFYGRVDGDSMIGLGIDEGDIAVIDRSIEAEHGDIVVSYINGEFNIKLLDLTHVGRGCMDNQEVEINNVRNSWLW